MKVLGEVFYIDKANVGIGTTSPRQQLDIQTGHVIIQGNLGIGTTLPSLPLAIHSTSAILLPSGLTEDRPSNPETGTIRYNSQLQQFEGYGAGNQWGSLGGVRSTDQTTYITASNDSNLRFYTASTLQAIINPDGNLGIGTTTPATTLHLVGSSLLDGPITTNNNPIDAGTATITATTFAGTATQVSNPLSAGQYIQGSQFTGQSPVTWDIKAASNNTPETLVARSLTGEILSSALGIGTTTSRHPLDIIGTAILTNGNLGIGTTSPLESIHTTGYVRANGYKIGEQEVITPSGKIPWSNLTDYPTITTSTGLQGGSSLSNNLTLSVDSTVVRTTGDYSLSGTLTFTGGVLNMNNRNITNVNNITISDPGPNEGISWSGGNLWRIYESPDDLANTAGNLQFLTNNTRQMTIYTDGSLGVQNKLNSLSVYTSNVTIATNLGIGTTSTRQPLDVLGTTIITNGNLGIGTTNPLYTLHLEGNSLLNGSIETNNNNINAGTATITAQTFSGTATQVSNPLSSGQYIQGPQFTGQSPVTWDIKAASNNTPETLVARSLTGEILSSYLGIGTTASRQPLDIVGTSIINSGNLGIGTNNPLYSLHLEGNALLNGPITTNNNNINAGTGTVTAQTFSGTATQVSNSLSSGQYIQGASFDGQSPVTWDIKAASNNTPETLVARSLTGEILSSYLGIGTTTTRYPLDIVGTSIITNGNLGIGTNIPLYSLHLEGNALLNGPITTNNNNVNAGSATITAQTFSGTATKVSNQHSTGQYILGSPFDGQSPVSWDIKAASNNTPETLVARSLTGEILSSSLGIGTTTTRYPLDIVGTSIITNGNLGIGTNNPLYALHLEGNALLNGPITTNNNNINAGTATITAQTFAGTATQVSSTLTRGNYLLGNNYNGSSPTTWDADATTTPTPSKLVARDANATIFAGNLGIGTTATRHPIDLVGTSIITSGNLGIGVLNPLEALHVQGNALFSGTLTTSNLSVIGTFTTIDTVTSNTDQVVITNNGTGPALKVTQTGNNTLAEFYDYESGIALYIANDGLIGIGTTIPTEALTVNGNITVGTGTITAQTFAGTATQVSNPLTAGQYIQGASFDGQSPVTWNIKAASNAIGETLVARSATGEILSSYLGIGTTASRYPLDVIGTSIINSGNLGIGTNNPLYSLHLEGNAYLNGPIETNNNNINAGTGTVTAQTFSGTATQVSNSHTAGQYLLGASFDGQSAVTWDIKAASNAIGETLVARSATGEILSSYLGIGTTASRYPLDVIGTSIINSGNLGIGTNNPLYSLHLEGNAYLNGPIETNNNNINAGTGTVTAQTFSGTATQVSNSHTAGQYLLGASFDGQSAVTWNIKAASNAIGETLVARSATGEILSSYLGIGTTASRYPLDVIGTSIINSGNLGIGTNNPLYSLHLEGNALLNGPIETNNNNINAGSATITAQTFSGTATQVSNSLSAGQYILGTQFTGQSPVTWDIKATSNNTPETLVARDANAAIFAGNLGIGTTATRQPIDLNNTTIINGNLGIGTTSPPVSLAIFATDALLLPKGTEAERPASATQGYIRYNTSTSQFEGYGAGNAWGALGGGGVSSTDGYTYITAELTPGANDSNIRFYTGTTLQAILNPQGNLGIGTTLPTQKLHVEGNVFVTGTLTASNIVYSNPNSNFINRLQIASSKATFLVPPTGQSNFQLTVPGLYKVEPQDIAVHLNGYKLAYINTTCNDYLASYTNLTTDTRVDISTRRYLKEGDVVDIEAYPTYLSPSGIEQPGYVIQNITNTGYWNLTLPSSNLTYTNGNIGIGTTNPTTPLHVIGNITLQGSILPTACNVYNLGSTDYRFKDLYLSGNSIDLGGAVISSSGGAIVMPAISVTGSTTISVDDSSNLTLSNSNVNVLRLPVEAEWAVRIDGAGNDSPTAFTLDDLGNSYLAGIVGTGSIILYNPDGTASDISIRTPTTSSGYAVKYNSQGIPQWAVSIDGATTEQALAVATDTQNNLFMGGIYNTTSATVSIYNSNNVLSDINLRASSGNYSGYAIKYNQGGIAQWAVSVDGTGNDGTVGLATDVDNKLYMAGQVGGTAATVYNANNTSSGFAFRISSGFAAFATKHNANGIFEWGVSIDGVGTSELGRAIAVDTNCNVYLGGYYTSTSVNLDIYNSNNALSPITIRPATAFGGAFLVKYNPNGIAQWAATVDNYSPTQLAYSIATDTIGNVYLAGSYSNNAAIVYNSNNIPSPITLRSPTNGSIAAFLVKYNTDGLAQWAATVDAVSTDIGYNVSTDIYNNAYLSGYYSGASVATLYDATGIPSTIQLRQSASTTQPVAYGIKFNPNGIAQWAVTVDGTGNDQGRGFFADTDGNVYLGGYYTGTPSIYNPNNTLSPITIGAALSVGGYIVKYRNNTFNLLSDLTPSQQGTLKYVTNTSTSPIPLSIRDSTNTTTLSTTQIPPNSTEQYLWYNNTWQSLTPTLSPLKGGTGNSNLPYNKLLVSNGPTDPLLAPNNLHWDNTYSRLGIGTTSPNYTLQVQGDLFVSGAFLNPSDQNLKSNLQVIPDALEKLNHIQGYTYTPINNPSKRYAGVLAQELQAILPEAVQQDQSGTLAVNYDGIIPLLIQAIRELQEKVNNLSK